MSCSPAAEADARSRLQLHQVSKPHQIQREYYALEEDGSSLNYEPLPAVWTLEFAVLTLLFKPNYYGLITIPSTSQTKPTWLGLWNVHNPKP